MIKSVLEHYMFSVVLIRTAWNIPCKTLPILTDLKMNNVKKNRLLWGTIWTFHVLKTAKSEHALMVNAKFN